ncbi:hypothetical protein VNO80_31637 [Phaseolus coccineus]|uniref:Uncharacterized protein n=1 Tax=Phaseolus coccineus TaxID=3886 RepID=A0AAN9L1G8_PHACN
MTLLPEDSCVELSIQRPAPVILHCCKVPTAMRINIISISISISSLSQYDRVNPYNRSKNLQSNFPGGQWQSPIVALVHEDSCVFEWRRKEKGELNELIPPALKVERLFSLHCHYPLSEQPCVHTSLNSMTTWVSAHTNSLMLTILKHPFFLRVAHAGRLMLGAGSHLICVKHDIAR